MIDQAQGWISDGGQIHFVTMNLPALEESHVRIEIKAAGINRADLLQRDGHYHNPSNPILGLEVSGIITHVGSHVTSFQVGDAVMALLDGGGYASNVNADASLCIPIPAGFTFSQAAALPEALFTWWNCLYDFHELRDHDSLLIHGGSSGIGTIGIQLARHFGAHVFVTVGTPEKALLCQTLGASHSILYNQEDFAERILSLTHNQGVGYIVDCVGGEYLPKNIQCLQPHGTLIVIGAQRGVTGSLPLATLMIKNASITGSTLRDKSVTHKSKLAKKMTPVLTKVFHNKAITPIIFKEFTLQEAPQALGLMQSRQHHGKIVLNLE
jgi:NADPH2:quinone reductase